MAIICAIGSMASTHCDSPSLRPSNCSAPLAPTDPILLDPFRSGGSAALVTALSAPFKTFGICPSLCDKSVDTSLGVIASPVRCTAKLSPANAVSVAAQCADEGVQSGGAGRAGAGKGGAPSRSHWTLASLRALALILGCRLGLGALVAAAA